MGGSSELEVIDEIKSVVESLTLWLRITVWKWLTLEEQLDWLCKKASQKVSAVARISSEFHKLNKESVSLIYS